MFKIGDFSKLSQVTVKTLRYYDRIGLLKPAQVDQATGYRYYSADQLPRLNRILALKDLGFSLEQIAPLLGEHLSAAHIRGMFLMRQAEIQQQLAEEQRLLTRVEARLKLIEQEDLMTAYEVIIKMIKAQTVAGIRDAVPTYGDQGPLWQELGAYLAKAEIKASGFSFTVYYDPEYRERDVDLEVCTPISAKVAGNNRVKIHALPEVQVASIVHQGGYDTLSQAYNALLAWIEANDYRIIGPNREVYVRCPDNEYEDASVFKSESTNEPATYVTEVQFPIEKA